MKLSPERKKNRGSRDGRAFGKTAAKRVLYRSFPQPPFGGCAESGGFYGKSGNYTKYYVFHRHFRLPKSVGTVDKRRAASVCEIPFSHTFQQEDQEIEAVENRNPSLFCGKVCGLCGKLPPMVGRFPRNAGDFPRTYPQSPVVIHNLLKTPVEKSTRTMGRENALGKGGGKRRRSVGLAGEKGRISRLSRA